nr:MAG TPA: Major capsid protein [Caudoviricetes sp.]
MSTMNLSDLFTLAELTKAINTLPTPTTVLGDSKLFKVESTKHLYAVVENINGKLVLVENTSRNAEPSAKQHGKRVRRVFEIPHLPKTTSLLPDEMVVAGFGESSEQDEQSKVLNNKLQELKNDIEATKEYHRIGAINGVIYDADGTSVIYDLYKEFGVKQITVSLDLDNPNADVRGNIIKAKRQAQKKLGGAVVKEWKCYCSSEMFDKLTAHANVQKAYANYAEASDKLSGDKRDGFEFGGVKFIEYEVEVMGTNGKLIRYIKEGVGRLVPVVDGLFKTIYAPANYNETVGTLGKDMYAKIEPRKMGKGYDVEAQSNPLSLCTQPDALIELTA